MLKRFTSFSIRFFRFLSQTLPMTTISDSGERTIQEPQIPEKTLISRDESTEDTLKIVSLPPLENDSVVSETKQEISSSFTSILEKDGELIHSDSVEDSLSETKSMNMESHGVISVTESKIGEELQENKETYSANVSLEITKEDDVHKIEEVGKCKSFSNKKERSKSVKKVQDSNPQRLLEAALAGAHKIEKNRNRRSVKIEMIDDTALVDVSFYKKFKDHPKKPVTAKTVKDASRNHKKVAEKPNGSKTDGKKQLRMMYSRNQMELMRYVDIETQKKLWSDLYARLLPELVNEYEGLVCSKKQMIPKPNMRESGFGILGPILAVPRRNLVNVYVQ